MSSYQQVAYSVIETCHQDEASNVRVRADCVHHRREKFSNTEDLIEIPGQDGFIQIRLFPFTANQRKRSARHGIITGDSSFK